MAFADCNVEASDKALISNGVREVDLLEVCHFVPAEFDRRATSTTFHTARPSLLPEGEVVSWPMSLISGGPRFLAILPLVSSLACAAPVRSLRSTDLATKAETNPLAAQRDFAAKEVVVEGNVRSTTLATSKRVAVDRQLFGVSAHEVVDSVPLVVLEPGTVFCYFDPSDLADAAEILRGQDVRLSCFVDSFRADGLGHVTSILANCKRK